MYMCKSEHTQWCKPRSGLIEQATNVLCKLLKSTAPRLQKPAPLLLRLDALNLNGPVPTMASLGGVISTGRSVRERQPLAPLHGEWAAQREATRSPPPAVVPPPLSASWGVGGGTWTGLQVLPQNLKFFHDCVI